MENNKKKQSGFTLVEVLLSMAMLMVIVVPLLSYFSNNAKFNHRAKIQQRATTVGEQIMEEVKSFATIKDLTDYYAGAVPDTGIASKEKYYDPDGSGSGVIRDGSGYVFKDKVNYTYWKKGVKSDKGEFNVKITVNPGTDGEGGHKDDTADLRHREVNDKKIPAITSLTLANTAVAKDQDFIENRAIDHFRNLSGGKTDDATIKSSLTKRYTIDITGSRIEKSGTLDEKRYVTVKISVKYTSSLCGDDKTYEAMLYNGLETEEEKLTGIYLFYNLYEGATYIDVKFSAYTSPAVNVKLPNTMVYAICQNADADQDTSSQKVEGTISGSGTFTYKNIFSNIKSDIGGFSLAKNMDDMVGTEFVQRISDIKVEVYPIENGKQAASPKAILNSTRGE